MVKQYFALSGKRDIHGVESQYDAAMERLQSTERWVRDGNRLIVIEYLKACRRGKVRSGRRYRRVSKAWLYRILGMLRMLSDTWLRKEFDEVTPEEWNVFHERIEDDLIRNISGKAYKMGSKARIYRTIMKFLKWRYGKDRNYPDFCADWIVEDIAPSKDAMARAEVDKMTIGAKELKGKAIIMMLFDGGFRAEELFNLRWVDVKRDEGKVYWFSVNWNLPSHWLV